MALAIIPMLVMGVLISVVSFNQLSKTIQNETENSLRAAAEAVLAAYNQNTGEYFQNENGDIWKGGYNISKSQALIDGISENTGMAVTFFYGEKRIVTSLKDKNGKYITGSPAGDTIKKQVLEGGNSYFTNRVSVEGTLYYGYYIPVYQNESDTEIIGMVFVGTQKAEVTQKITSVCMLIAVILVVSMLITLVIVIFVSHKMSVGIKSGIQTLSDIADGNLTTEVNRKYLDHKDEIGELIQSTDRLKGSLLSIVSGLAGNTEELGASSSHMNEILKKTSEEIATMEQAIHDIAASAGQQAESAGEASEGITVIDKMIENATRETDELGVAAEEMKQAGMEVSGTLESLNTVNEEVLKAVRQIYQDTNMTNEAADNIREAVEVIMEIAEETNLLSLNASIEAARAGESGKGFAVVATQIQKLAEQSSESSDRINQIVERLRTSSNQSVQTMEQVQKVINKQSEDIGKTKEIFGGVEQGIQKSLSGIQQIQTAVSKLEQAEASIVNLIQTLSTATHESEKNTSTTLEAAHMVKEVVETLSEEAGALKKMAEDISQSVSSFKL